MTFFVQDCTLEEMVKNLPLSEVRKNLSHLLKRIRKTRNLTVRITVNGIPAGELRAIETEHPHLNGGEALLHAMSLVGNPKPSKSAMSVAEAHDQFLYPAKS